MPFAIFRSFSSSFSHTNWYKKGRALHRVSSQITAGAERDLSYDSVGRLSTVGVNGTAQQDTYSYDALSRSTKVTHSDTTYSQLAYANNCVTSTDESSKVRQICSDGLGRTSKAVEDPSGLNYSTTYAYDGLNDLTTVTQGSESRAFTYDGLGRMTQAVTPESGTVNYTYDSDPTCGTSTGDLVKRVDARSIRTCYAYDSIHRRTSNTYSDTTPTASFSYDQTTYNGLTISNGKGKQTGMSDGSGQTAWSFDSMGRIVSQEKTISSITRMFGYAYNYDGSLGTMTYPSGRTITYTVDSFGRPATAKDVANAINYVTGGCSGGGCYAPQNALASLVSGSTGSFGGITYSVGYSNRLWPSSISASSTNGTALSLSYGYWANGDVQTVTNNRDNGRTATYLYDSLNRINSASSQAASGTDCWGQSVPSGGYDRYGNLLTINVSKCSAPSLSVSVNAKNQITGFGYDASGNETGDGTYTYTWDAESRMKSAAGITYTFDASGRRVKDSSPKLFWYGLNGSVLAETDSSGNTVNEYIFFDGMRIARRDSSGNVYYYFGNALGSAAVTTAGGSLCDDADFYPLGGELVFLNTCAQNYRFAGMEQTPASGYYMAAFREYASSYGRWASPDPSGTGAASLANPQTWNMYTYVTNNPTTFRDPLGLDNCENFGATVAGSDGAWIPDPCQIAPGVYDASYNGPAITWQYLQNQTWQSADGAISGATGNAEYTPLPTGVLNGWSNDAGGPGDIGILGQKQADIAFKDLVDLLIADNERAEFGHSISAYLDLSHGFTDAGYDELDAAALDQNRIYDLNKWEKTPSAPGVPPAPCNSNASLLMGAWKQQLAAWLQSHPGQAPPAWVATPPSLSGVCN